MPLVLLCNVCSVKDGTGLNLSVTLKNNLMKIMEWGNFKSWLNNAKIMLKVMYAIQNEETNINVK